MSLELAIQQNTAAINTLIEILSKGAPAIGAQAEPDAPAPVETEAPKAKRTKKEAKPEAPAGESAKEASAPAPTSGATDAPATEAAAAPTEEKQVSYTEAAQWVTRVAKANRQAAVDILARYGAKTLGEVKASNYAAVIRDCEAVL